MRNNQTDMLGVKLTKAYIKSNLDAGSFLAILLHSRENILDYNLDSCTFLVPVQDNIAQFYFSPSHNEWFCKF